MSVENPFEGDNATEKQGSSELELRDKASIELQSCMQDLGFIIQKGSPYYLEEGNEKSPIAFEAQLLGGGATAVTLSMSAGKFEAVIDLAGLANYNIAPTISKIKEGLNTRGVGIEPIFLLNGEVLSSMPESPEPPPSSPDPRLLEASVEKEMPWFLQLRKGDMLIAEDNRHLFFTERHNPPDGKYVCLDADTRESVTYPQETFEQMCDAGTIRVDKQSKDLDEFLEQEFKKLRESEQRTRTSSKEVKRQRSL
ncbi:MAG: hypothetical protein EXS48_02590 [Candidatus Staskawiczbacteria bacterium]|nr:hypothetical protein [Candidatus Staskawiczbacteria bacterium]